MLDKINNKIRGGIQRQILFIKYMVVGISASFLDLAILILFKEYFDLWYLNSAILAFTVSFSTAFVAQKYWTFGDYSQSDIQGQFLRYLITIVSCLGLSLTILYSLVEFAGFNYILGQLVALSITGLIGFVMTVRNVFGEANSNGGIIVASGIFPPDIGGPASHVKRLAEELASRGVKVSVITYSRSKNIDDKDNIEVNRVSGNFPAMFRGAVYLSSLFTTSINYPNIFAQDITSTGLPAMIVKKVLPVKRLVIRVGGDLLWEREVESGRTQLSLSDYYAAGSHRTRPLFKIGKMVMGSADRIVVPADFLKDIYVKYYNIPANAITVIKNPLPIGINSRAVKTPREEKTILYAGRFIKLKNVTGLIRVFRSLYPEIKPARLVLIGDGPERQDIEDMIRGLKMEDSVSIVETLPREELMSRIAGADLCVCVSLTDVNPNFILECLAEGRPALLTRNNGLSIRLPEEMLVSYDNEDEFRDKMRSILAGSYDIEKLKSLVLAESAKSSWESVVAEYLKIFSTKGAHANSRDSKHT